MIRKTCISALLALVAIASMSSAALAQTQAVINTPAVKATYSAATIALAPAAATTDFFTLTGSASKTIRITRAGCNGVSTAAATATIVALKRSTANSAGTSTTLTAVPHDSTLAAASGTAKAYTANPTTGTLVGNLRAGSLTTTTAASSAVPALPLIWEFGDGRQNYPVTLRGTAQVFSLNGNGGTFSAGTALNCTVTWVEE